MSSEETIAQLKRLLNDDRLYNKIVQETVVATALFIQAGIDNKSKLSPIAAYLGLLTAAGTVAQAMKMPETSGLLEPEFLRRQVLTGFHTAKGISNGN